MRATDNKSILAGHSFRFLTKDSPSHKDILKKFPEWAAFEKAAHDLEPFGKIHHLGFSKSLVKGQQQELPLVAISLGNQDPSAPVLGVFGGVHGLERIGSQVALALMKSLSELLLWDEMTKHALGKIRILFFPIINPFGVMHVKRSNPNGVDLMRNSPVEAEGKVPRLIGGHKIGPWLPWYRGQNGVEPEAQAVIDFCREQFFQSKTVINIDFHSGFGVQDQIWFPYAKSREPFPHLPETYALLKNFERTYPHHFYKIEPQALNYTTHGDLWDYIYQLYCQQNPTGTYIPLCIEMGSWMWVRKNPLQLFSALGPYNPIKPHRQKRILRRHMTLFDFLIRSTFASENWSTHNLEQKNRNLEQAKELWYRRNFDK